MTFLILFFGFLFGAILQYAQLNRYNTISGMAMLTDLRVAKAIAIAVGLGAILLSIEIGLGFAGFHAKPMILGGIAIGGLIFGVGMAILGYCPGTMAISLGEGSMDALVGIIGGLLGGIVYTVLLPSIKPILGPDFGVITLKTIIPDSNMLYYLLTFIIGAIFIAAAFWMQKIEKTKDFKWLTAGVGLAILNLVVFLTATTNRPIGASTSYPYVADLLTGITANDYFAKIKGPGNWELIFLAGAFLSGLLLSLFRGDFKFTLIHLNWKLYKGGSSTKRIIWAFVGGFILIFGARMAGGCTSGHVISGGMQLAVSSLVFGVFVFAGLLITGKLFYGRASTIK